MYYFLKSQCCVLIGDNVLGKIEFFKYFLDYVVSVVLFISISLKVKFLKVYVCIFQVIDFFLIKVEDWNI